MKVSWYWGWSAAGGEADGLEDVGTEVVGDARYREEEWRRRREGKRMASG